MNRREFALALASLSVAQAFGLSAASAQAIGTLKMLIPANPGGGWDQTGRNLAAAMQAGKLVGSVQFENKGGAAGTIGLAQFVNSAKGDPNAVMIAGMVMVGGIILNKSPVDLSMVTPIARLTSEYEVIVVPSSSPHKTMGDLIKAYKANPGAVSWGGGSAGGTDHILGGLVAKAVGEDPSKVNYVAFKGGGDAIAAIVGGHVTAGISGVGEFAEQIKGGRMRALAVSSPDRIDGIPTLKEQGADVEFANWRGFFAAPGISAEQAKAYADLLKQMQETATWEDLRAKNGWQNLYLPGEQFVAFLKQQEDEIGGLMRELGFLK